MATFHVTMHIDNGILSRARYPRQLDGIFKNAETDADMTGEEVIAFAKEKKLEGFEAMPVCDNHDRRGRCQGHPTEGETQHD